MSDLKISQLSDGGAAQAADEYVVARSGANFRIDGASVAAAATSVGTLSSLTVSGSITTPVIVSSTDAATTLAINNTNANAWGGNLAIRTGGVDAGYFGTIGSLLGSTSQDLAIYATAGNGFRVYTNGNNLRATIDTSGNLGLGVTPSAWGSGFRALQVNTTSVMDSSLTSYFVNNAYFDGSAWRYVANGSAALYSVSSGIHSWFNAASGTAGDGSPFTARMTLDASGNLGVGTTSPSTFGKLATVAATTAVAFYAGTGTQGLFISTDDSTRLVTYASSGSLGGGHRWNVGNTEAARITSGGVFMVGTTGLPGANGSAASFSGSGNVVRVYGTTEANGALMVDKSSATVTSSQIFVQFTTDAQGSANGQINGNGAGQVAFGTWSDERLKENIVDLDSQWNNVKALRPVEFDYIESRGGGHQVGFIAQHVQAVYDDLVSEGQDGFLALSGLGKNEARLIKALQEAMARIEALEARLEALEA
jgi:hypothetical protein